MNNAEADDQFDPGQRVTLYTSNPPRGLPCGFPWSNSPHGSPRGKPWEKNHVVKLKRLKTMVGFHKIRSFAAWRERKKEKE